MTDDGIYTTEDDSVYSIRMPVKSDWECLILGDMITVHPDEGKVPNRFHRWMHYLFFGAKWRKVKK